MLKTIKLVILTFFIFFIILGISLFYGIKIDSFTLGNFSVSQFYLKLDKKLILKTKKLVFKSNKNSSNSLDLQAIQRELLNLDLVLKIFKEIDVEELHVNDNVMTFHLDDSHIYYDNNFVNFSSHISTYESLIKLNIYSIYLKKQQLLMLGDVKIDLENSIASFLGKYKYKDTEGELNTKITKKQFDFYINTSNEVKSISFLRDFFRIDKVAEAWMYDNVEGDIKLNYLYGKIDLKKQKPIMNSIKGEAIVKNAKIEFNKEAKKVITPKLTVTYSNDKLSFDLEDPTYGSSKLYGSKVYITDLTSLKKGTVYVDLKSNSMLNEDVLEILKAYKIKLPLKQNSGVLDSKLLLSIPYLSARKMHVDGEFKAKEAEFALGNFNFFATDANVVLKDNDVLIKKAHVIRKNLFEADLTLNIDTKKRTAKGEALINSFKIANEDSNLVDIQNIETPVEINFKDKTYVSLDTFNTVINLEEDSTNVRITKLASVYDYSDILKGIGAKEGNIELDIFDENNIHFKAYTKELDLPFEKNLESLHDLNFNGVIKNSTTFIKTNDGSISIVLKDDEKPNIKLDGIDLVLSNENSNYSGDIDLPNVNVSLKDAKIKIDKEHMYETSWANISIEGSKVNFEGEALNVDLPISKDGKKIDKLLIDGSYEKGIVTLNTKDNKLKLKYDIPKESVDLNLENYDVIYNTEDETTNTDSSTKYFIEGKNSNIIINQKHIAKATSYDFTFEKDNTIIDLVNNETKFFFKKDAEGKIELTAKNMSDTFLNGLFGKNLINGGYVDIVASGENNIIKGYSNINNSKIVDLAILNNLIILINTSPGIINPFLAIPSVVGMATNGGFNLNGYRITEGKVDFSYDINKKYLDMNKIKTKGNGIDFDGNMTIDFLTSKVDAKLKLIFFKNYSKIVGAIPVINYILLGDEKRVDTEVTIYGTLEDPKYKTNLVKEGVSAPVNFLKRIITSPVNLIKSFTSDDDKEVESDKSKEEDSKTEDSKKVEDNKKLQETEKTTNEPIKEEGDKKDSSLEKESDITKTLDETTKKEETIKEKEDVKSE